uniref:Putative treble-clef zinc-finger domain-containing protein n=1 Tax=Scophthalmus maximus TaxID=52904 RepID=A0A8D3CVA2_SCOMX
METEVTVSSSPSLLSSPAPQTLTTQASLVAKQRDSRKGTPATPAFLSNLGRATLRGIRRCPQCGVYNGTRGLSCKNKACGVSLRNASAAVRNRKKCAVEVVKVVIDSEERGGKERDRGGVLGGGSGGGVQVFSVCHRGRGTTATQLGFVELVPTDTAIATGDGATLLTQINLGRCFLPACRQGQRSNHGGAETAAASSKQSFDSLCVHIKQAIECQSRATPLAFKSSVLEGLQASIQAREELWRLATGSPGPLVQRVSKDTLVVKCNTDSHHPLGLLHLTVGAGGLSEVSKTEIRGRETQQHGIFHCACQVSSSNSRRNKPGVDGAGGAASFQPAPSPASPQPCLHFYACVCAFASDEKLASEFTPFISYTPSAVQPSATSGATGCGEKPLQQAEPANSHHKAKKLRPDESLSVAPASWLGKEGAFGPGLRRAGQRKTPGAGGLKAPGGAQGVDELTVMLGFHQWLASVTERIHQTMHYQFDGKPQPLVYLIPQEFFNALQHRLSLGSKKRRLPNFTTPFVRNDGLPPGSFSKYTWHITSLMQVKRIFDTPELPLELYQSFVKNIDGSYSRFRCPEPPPESEFQEGYRTDRPLAIRPMELRTFLRVGPGAADQKEAGPFVIEWIPDVLPRCQMGELRISFEFGHQRSGQPENCEKTSAAEKGGRGKSDSPQSKHTKAVGVLQVVV